MSYVGKYWGSWLHHTRLAVPVFQIPPPPLSACCGLQALVRQWPSGWSPRPFPGLHGRLPQELPSCPLANYSLLSLPTMLGSWSCHLPNFICRLLDIWLVLPPLLVASLLMPVTACPSCDQAPHLRDSWDTSAPSYPTPVLPLRPHHAPGWPAHPPFAFSLPPISYCSSPGSCHKALTWFSAPVPPPCGCRGLVPTQIRPDCSSASCPSISEACDGRNGGVGGQWPCSS